MAVFQLLYASGGARQITTADIDDILEKSRRNNAALGVTGMLLFADNMFIQVLEGEERDVRDLARRISRDQRHRNFMELIEQTSPERAFARWQMGSSDCSRIGPRTWSCSRRLATRSTVASAPGTVA